MNKGPQDCTPALNPVLQGREGYKSDKEILLLYLLSFLVQPLASLPIHIAKCHYRWARSSVGKRQIQQLIPVSYQVNHPSKTSQSIDEPNNTALWPEQLASTVGGDQVKIIFFKGLLLCACMRTCLEVIVDFLRPILEAWMFFRDLAAMPTSAS